MTKTVILEKEDTLRIITLNRPESANTLNLELSKDLYDAVLSCYNDKSVKALLITAKGKIFCGGGDLKFLLSKKELVEETLLQMTNYLHGAISLMAKINAPIVVAVNGTAGGGGLSLAISGDYVISASSAKYTLAYTKAGLSPDASSTYYLPRLIGMRKAKELMLTNRVLDATEALEIGMIDKIVEDEKLYEEARKQIDKFVNGATGAYGDVKKLLNSSYSNSLESQMALEGICISKNAKSKDGQEGMLAFAEKRSPIFKG